MRKITFSFLAILLCALLVGCASTPPTATDSEQMQTGSFGVPKDVFSTDEAVGYPPSAVFLYSEEQCRELYEALKYESDEELRQFIESLENRPRLAGIQTCENLKFFWQKLLALPLPNLETVPGVSDFGIEYYPERQSFVFWYVAGGRQYRFIYLPGDVKTSEAVLNPVATGELHGAEIALKALPEGSSFEQEANFHVSGYNVKLLVRKDLNSTDPEPLFLNFSNDPWVTFDKNSAPEFHMQAK